MKNEAMTATPAAGAAEWLTTGSLVLIAVAIVVVLIAILWGMRLKRRRAAAETQIEDASAVPEVPSVEASPVAPAPPPLAGDDTPVVATAPFEAAPATLAADLATPPAPASVPPTGSDDLMQLKGVGPKLAARLNQLGIVRFAQIADLSPSEATALDAELGAFAGRLERDRWIEQARYLASGDRAGFEAEFGRL